MVRAVTRQEAVDRPTERVPRLLHLRRDGQQGSGDGLVNRRLVSFANPHVQQKLQMLTEEVSTMVNEKMASELGKASGATQNRTEDLSIISAAL
jgi:hypothetical protein